MSGEDGNMADLRSSDILAYDWANRAREILDAHKKNPEAKKAPGLYPGGTFKLTEDKKPSNALYRLLSDPQLNRGLQNIAEAVPEAVLGRESGNAAVDLGAANIPGIGAGAILAAGGMPGVLDVAGLGEVKTLMKGLKHAGKIGENTINYILRNFDQDAVYAVDNYIDKFPKVGSVQIPDAYKILTEGRSGNVYMPVEKPESFQPHSLINVDLENTIPDIEHRFEKFYANNAEADSHIPDELKAALISESKKVRQNILNTVDNGDFVGAMAQIEALESAMRTGNPEYVLREMQDINNGSFSPAAAIHKKFYKDLGNTNKKVMELNRNPTEDDLAQFNAINDYVITQFGKTQDLEKIEAAQLRTEANKAAKQAKKAQKAAQLPEAKPSQILGAQQATDVAQNANREADLAKVEADRARYQKNLEKRHEENRALTQQQQAAAAERNAATETPIVREIEETPAPQVMRGGPNQWRENGWSSTDHTLDYESVLGKRDLTEDEKRDAFVLDSLASHWANRLRQTSPVKEWAGRGNFEHMHTNYGMNLGRAPGVADQFIADVIKNKTSGNMPGTSFKVYRNPISPNPAAKVIDVEGYDIYYPLFHKKTDEKLNQLDSRYFFDAMDPQYVIKNKKISR